MPRFIDLIDLRTAKRTALRSCELGDPELEALEQLLKQARSGPVPIPGTDPALLLEVDARGGGRCITASITNTQGQALGLVAIAERSRCGAPMWKRLHPEDHPYKTKLKGSPAEPWCAFAATEALDPKLADTWLPAFAQALSWAFLLPYSKDPSARPRRL